MKKSIVLSVVCIFLLIGFGAGLVSMQAQATITVLYDNYVYKAGTQSDWGFSCLIEGFEKTILFDTGTKPEVLEHNLHALGVDLKKVDQVVITHNHQDHTGGLDLVLQKETRVSVCFPASFPAEFTSRIESHKAITVRVDKPVEICKGVMSTGEMGDQIKEQSLILDSPRGLIIVTGCSHPGIVAILKRVKEIRKRDIYLVLGGLHLIDYTDAQVEEIIRSFKSLGVQKCGVTHCTGDRPIELFKAAYGTNFIPMGTGRVVTVQ